MSKKSKEKEQVTEDTKELSVIKKKIAEINNQYKEKLEKRNNLVREVKAMDEELQKMVGSITTLRQVEAEVQADVKPDKKDSEEKAE